MKSIDDIAATCTSDRPTAELLAAPGDNDWRGKATVSFKDETHHWVRFTTEDGLFCWLHPQENRWVFEPDQIRMPDFPSYPAAIRALALAPRPPRQPTP
jgi:hypothetical protein